MLFTNIDVAVSVYCYTVWDVKVRGVSKIRNTSFAKRFDIAKTKPRLAQGDGTGSLHLPPFSHAVGEGGKGVVRFHSLERKF